MSLRQRGAADTSAASTESSWARNEGFSSDMATLDVRDRTSEFQQACKAAKSKRTAPGTRPAAAASLTLCRSRPRRAATRQVSQSSSRLTHSCLAPAARPTPARNKSLFMSDAGAIGKEIQSTSEKLERLAKRAQRLSSLGFWLLLGARAGARSLCASSPVVLLSVPRARRF